MLSCFLHYFLLQLTSSLPLNLTNPVTISLLETEEAVLYYLKGQIPKMYAQPLVPLYCVYSRLRFYLMLLSLSALPPLCAITTSACWVIYLQHTSRRDLERLDYPLRHPEFRYKTEFQSHEPEVCIIAA